jgi:acetyl-CoA carboxylase carboxyltransferase component
MDFLTLEERFKDLEQKNKEAEMGGGLEKIEKQKKSGKMYARERIEKLLEILAEGIIYVMLAEKVKNSRINSGNLNKQNDLISLEIDYNLSIRNHYN